jgi:hypothetical protein
MKFRSIVGLLLLAIILPLALPVHAQDKNFSPEEEALIADVQAAIDALFAIGTFQGRTESLITQIIGTSASGQSIELNQIIEQNSDMQVVVGEDAGISQSHGVMTQDLAMTGNLPGLDQNISMELETVFIDGQFYMRMNDGPPEMSTVFPDGWFRPEELNIPGFDFSALGNLSGREALSIYDVSPDTVSAIEEREGTTIDGQAMRVISLVFDADILFEIAGLDSLFDPAAMGLGEDFFNDMFEAAIFEYIIYIGVDDGIPHRIDVVNIITDMETEVQGQTISLTQDSNSTVTYFGFGEPVDIPIPDIAE